MNDKLVRFGVSMDKELLEKFDKMIEGTYHNRSEAIRDLIRDKIVEKEWTENKEPAFGSLTLLYDHHQRGLTEKMLEIQHKHHQLFKSNLHLHITHDYCLEVMVVQGLPDELQSVTNSLLGLKGVKHGKLTISSGGQSF